MAKHGFYFSADWRRLKKACLERDGHRCAVKGCSAKATHADHIETRPPVAHLTAADRLDNLRSLCAMHDAQVKERKAGEQAARSNGGEFKLVGCDADGWPVDPARR